VLEIEDLLALAIAAFVPCNALTPSPYLDIGRVSPDHRLGARMQRSRVGTGLNQNTTLPIHHRGAGIGKIKTLRRQWKQSFAFGGKSMGHGLGAPMDGPLFGTENRPTRRIVPCPRSEIRRRAGL
jgi:hypothetical protein